MRPPRAPVYLPSRARDHRRPVRVRRLPLRDARESRLPRRGLDEGSAQLRGASGPERLDLASGRWVRVRAVRMRAHSVTIRLALRPAAGALFRIRKPLPPVRSGAEAVFGRMRANVGRWHLVDSHGADVRASWCELARVPFGLRPGRAREVGSNGFWLCVRSDLAASALLRRQRRQRLGSLLPRAVGQGQAPSGRAPVLLSGDEQAHRTARRARTASGSAWGRRPGALTQPAR